MNDSYWVTEEGFEGTFGSFNLCENRFSRIPGLVAFKGEGSGHAPGLSSSPDSTTGGMLPKCWRRTGGQIRLYKGGTAGTANAGFEPYSEYYASQTAQVQGVSAISYSLSRWKGRLCSVCDLFTCKEISYVPAGRIVRKGGMPAARAFCESLGPEYVNALNDMLLFDAVTFNTDRHYGNFGFLADSRTNRIISPAPLFDHGNSLMNFAWGDDLKDEAGMWRYAATLVPCVYDDFVGEIRPLLSHEQHGRLRSLLSFRLKKHRRYNLPEKRLSLIEKTVSRRAAELLE